MAAGGKKLYDALAEKGRVATQGIYFDTGSDRIRPESTPTLKEIGTMLKDHPDLKLTIEGHTDNVGSSRRIGAEREAGRGGAAVPGRGLSGGRARLRPRASASKPAAPNDTPKAGSRTGGSSW